jgi:hypothetical protein
MGTCSDADRDGASDGGDCAPDDPGVHPDAAEIVGDAVDQDCDGTERCYADADDDGRRIDSAIASADTDCDDAGEATAAIPNGDCDDADAIVYPSAPEVAGDGIDQDCDGVDSPAPPPPQLDPAPAPHDDAKGCASTPAGPWFAVVLLARRRRRC